MKISTISVCLTITSEPATHYEWVVLDLVQTSLCQSWVDVVTLGHTRPRPRPSPALHNLKQCSGTGLLQQKYTNVHPNIETSACEDDAE